MNKNGQSLLEYSLIIGCVTVALLGMQVYFKRGIQGVVKATSDDLSSPAETFYTAQEGHAVNPQLLGVEETGLFEYTQHAPTNVTRRQESVATELARGQRELVINDDNTTTTGNWTVKYKQVDAKRIGITDDKGKDLVSSDSATPAK